MPSINDLYSIEELERMRDQSLTVLRHNPKPQVRRRVQRAVDRFNADIAERRAEAEADQAPAGVANNQNMELF